MGPLDPLAAISENRVFFGSLKSVDFAAICCNNGCIVLLQCTKMLNCTKIKVNLQKCKVKRSNLE